MNKKNGAAVLCKPCNTLFSSWEVLLKHKATERKNGNKHIHCKFCGQDFKTEVAEYQHIQQLHAEEQNLDCPGCGRGPFIRLGGLMDHIENQCTRMDATIITELREKKLEFPRRLEKLTQQPIKSNFANHMPSTKPKDYGDDVWEAPKDPDPFKLEETEFPELPTGPQPSEEAKAPSSESQQTPAPTVPSAIDMYHSENRDDPSHPDFNVARYLNKYSEKYECPNMFCNKSFKNSRGLIGHLNGPRHRNQPFTCPACLKRFYSLTAVSQHIESNGKFCKIRRAGNYRAYVDQLTGGIIDVADKPNEDGTAKYVLGAASEERMSDTKISSRGEAIQKDGYQFYNTDPIW